MGNISDKNAEKIKTYFRFNILFSENRAVFKIMWKNMVDTNTAQMTMQYGKATDTHFQNM
jgi:hypothetical protein